MTEQELKTRIEKKQADIQKIEKRIEKWTAGMNEEAKNIVKNCEVTYNDSNYIKVYNEYKQYKEKHPYDETVTRQDGEWNKGPNFSEAYNAYRDLAENKSTLNKYIEALNKLNNFNNMEKIEIIWNFLQDFKADVYNYVIENAKLYYELKVDYIKTLEEYKESEEGKERFEELASLYLNKNNYRINYTLEKEFDEKYYSEISKLTYEVYKYRGEVDINKLNKILDKDIQDKYNNLVHRITKEVGEITDANGLYIANNGEINGIVIGTKGKCRVETITAGGYNIQIEHFRVLVHKIK